MKTQQLNNINKDLSSSVLTLQSSVYWFLSSGLLLHGCKMAAAAQIHVCLSPNQKGTKQAVELHFFMGGKNPEELISMSYYQEMGLSYY